MPKWSCRSTRTVASAEAAPAGARRFRFVRRAARAQWYIGPVLWSALAVAAVLMVFLLGAQRSLVAWLACAALLALLGWRWWQERRAEAAFWSDRRRLEIWFADGQLMAWASEGDAPAPVALAPVRAIDALVAKGRVLRLLVDRDDGTRRLYAGLDDMDAFAEAFRAQAPQARFRRVRRAFPARLVPV